MRSRVVGVPFLLCALVLCVAEAQFVIPEPDFQALTTGGLRVSIPDAAGIRMFGFHARVNSPLSGKDDGPINGDVTSPDNGRWVFEDTKQMLQVDDVIYYRVFVQIEMLAFQRQGITYTVKKLVPPNTPWPTPRSVKKPPVVFTETGTQPTKPTISLACTQSLTVINGGKPACIGQLIFEENFNNSLDTAKWIVEQRLPAQDQENEFCSYQKSVVKTMNSSLTITPIFLSTLGYDSTRILRGQLDLSNGCTASMDDLCKLDASLMNVLHPIVSGMISTRGLFSFKYGKVEIRAKLPQGDWIYPELYLQPQTSVYGKSGYKSGVIRVAFSRGNRFIIINGQNYGNVLLSGGVVLDTDEPCRSSSIAAKSKEAAWGTEFHTYGIVWTKDSMVFSVDGVEYGTVVPPPGGFKSVTKDCTNLSKNNWPSENAMTPFDQEFYISLGVGVGGTSDFSDGITNKKWNNTNPRARGSFFREIKYLTASWTDDSKSMTVDSVKVWAL